ncbi:hypothetical protein QR680_010583 [Steinernema hermaphroditum]|uniref:Uncharacterized protein n=1 Tax=Steinernema hermaphroditum TaxID=289476 RepID=A0AA39MAY8_9BILA|nr:hypothetical protein QR680_010583 [Steinernema hermaphroditum]
MPNVHVKKKLSSFGKAARRASNKFRRNLQGGSSKAPEPPKAEIVEKKVSNEAAAAYPVALRQSDVSFPQHVPAMPRLSITEKLSDLKQAAKRAVKKVREVNLSEAQHSSHSTEKEPQSPPIQYQCSM